MVTLQLGDVQRTAEDQGLNKEPDKILVGNFYHFVRKLQTVYLEPVFQPSDPTDYDIKTVFDLFFDGGTAAE